MQRRAFLRHLSALGAALAVASRATAAATDPLGATLPRRRLGKNGPEVTVLGLGGYHIGLASERDAQATIEAALAGGVRFFDNAAAYQKGHAESCFGKWLVPKYRDQVFLMTKTMARTADQARADLDASLKRLNTDVLDLWQIHAVNSPADVDGRLANGVLDVLLDAKAKGKVRHLGFSGHDDPAAHVRMLEQGHARGQFAACQMPVNPVDAVAPHSFIRTTLPVALERGVGVLAMKTLGMGRFFKEAHDSGKQVWTTDNPIVPGHLSVTEIFHFALSLPISVLITGAETPELIREKIAAVRSFHAFSDEERKAVTDKVVSFALDGRVEHYKRRDLR
jgi:aryl-alcohol dehydrogenase-like predicted oxidoreductase